MVKFFIPWKVINGIVHNADVMTRKKLFLLAELAVTLAVIIGIKVKQKKLLQEYYTWIKEVQDANSRIKIK
jgi:hypothetical protein